MSAAAMIKRILPRSLFGRSLMIIVTPLVLLQLVTGIIFYESHWDKIILRLARNVAGDIGTVISLVDQQPAEERERIFGIAAENMGLVMTFVPDEIIPNKKPDADSLMERMLVQAMGEQLARPFRIDTESRDRLITIDVQLADGVLRAVTPRKRVFSSTAIVFGLWMVGSSLILFAVAVIFMRNQVKPIRRLAAAADAFGKGREVDTFKIEGATEVRQAANAFLAMRDRIRRQIAQRTDMLSGVSHDLRTPLTRMKLQLALIGHGPGVAELREDVADMERMLDEYLAFARGEGGEAPAPTDVAQLLEETVALARRKGGTIEYANGGALTVPVRPNAMKRCFTNVIENAARYGKHVRVAAGMRGDSIEIVVDDDGPGIPPEKREEVFRPFFRIDSSRNPKTGGVGLGLTIARDILRGHGGDITLDTSPEGGLRARMRVPI